MFSEWRVRHLAEAGVLEITEETDDEIKWRRCSPLEVASDGLLEGKPDLLLYAIVLALVELTEALKGGEP